MAYGPNDKKKLIRSVLIGVLLVICAIALPVAAYFIVRETQLNSTAKMLIILGAFLLVPALYNLAELIIRIANKARLKRMMKRNADRSAGRRQ